MTPSQFHKPTGYGGQMITHHQCSLCKEWSPTWQTLCQCNPDYGKEAIRKLKEWRENHDG